LQGSTQRTWPFTSVFVTIPKNWEVKFEICDGRDSQAGVLVTVTPHGLEQQVVIVDSQSQLISALS
jgi:hypothetical protein